MASLARDASAAAGGLMPNGPPPPGVAPLPGWLGPIVTLTTQVGVPTVVAGVLLWFVLFRVDSTLKLIQENEENRTRMVAAMQDSLVGALEHNAAVFDKAIDRNIAVNEEQGRRLEQLFFERKRPVPPN